MIEKLIAFIFLTLLIPVILLIGLVILIQFRKNPIFIQERGLSLTTFRFKILKFRTMDKHFPKRFTNINVIKSYDDAQSPNAFTRFLRNSGLDELPQLINIIKGDMNLIGPRPLDLKDLNHIAENFPDLYKKRAKLKLKPGLTGYWQVFKGCNRSIQNLIARDVYYAKNKSFKLNLQILFKSLFIYYYKHNKTLI